MSTDYGTDDWFSVTAQGIVLKIQAQPKASRSEVMGLHGTPSRLKIRIAAPPVDGEANEELVRFLKKLLRGPGVRISLLKGSTSKIKEVLCEGIDEPTIRQVLGIP